MDVDTAYEIHRLFPVGPERLFAAFTNPAILKNIWGLSAISVDARVGGQALAKMEITGKNWNFTITYTEIVPARTLRWVTHFQRFPNKETRVTLLFEKTAEGTQLTLRQENFETSQERNANREALINALSRLAGLLTSSPL